MTTETDYTWWSNALAGNVGPISDGYPECGFYRRKQKDKTFCAVAIWRNADGELVAVETRGNSAHPVDAQDTWTWVAKYPIPEALYRAYCDTGRWPDMDKAVAEQVERGIGDNMPPDDVETLADQIESAKAGIAAYETIGDDETLAKAQSLRSRLLELSRTADKKRDEIKRPHLDACKTIDGTWMPLVKDAKAAADIVLKRMNDWENEKLRRERDAQRKADEERRAAEEAARAAEAEGAPAPAPEPEPAPQPAPAPAAPIRGAYGRAASVKLVKVVTNITDIDALLSFLRMHPEMTELARRLAQRAVDKGHDVPGVEVEEQRKVA